MGENLTGGGINRCHPTHSTVRWILFGPASIDLVDGRRPNMTAAHTPNGCPLRPPTLDCGANREGPTCYRLHLEGRCVPRRGHLRQSVEITLEVHHQDCMKARGQRREPHRSMSVLGPIHVDSDGGALVLFDDRIA